MTLVSNKGRTPLGLPGGEQVPARGSVEVDDEAWTKAQESATVKRWVEAGVLTEGELPEQTDEEIAAEQAAAAGDPNRVTQAEWDAAHAAGDPTPYDYQPPGERPEPEGGETPPETP